MLYRYVNSGIDAVAFLSPEQGISKAERRLIDLYSKRKLLLVICNAPDKAEAVSDYLGSNPNCTVGVVCLDCYSSALREFLWERMSSEGMVIDITYAPSYYASSLTALVRADGVSVFFTPSDGDREVIVSHGEDYSTLDEDDAAIVRALAAGPKEPHEVIDATGINAKTVYRRLSSLEKRGFIGRGPGGRPIIYRLDQNQRFLFTLSGLNASGERAKPVLEPSWIVSDRSRLLR